MRILIKALILNEVVQPVNKHGIQGFIYHQLKQTSFTTLHQKVGFKFFCFTDIFPISEYKRGGVVNLIISSPLSRMIEDISRTIERGDRYNWGGWRVQVQRKKIFDIPLRRTWITGSPILIRYDESGHGDNYFSIERGHSLQVFLQRLKQNALKKYLAFYGEIPDFDEPIFEELIYNKSVAVQIDIQGQILPMIGSKWKIIRLNRKILGQNKKLFKFLFDVGLGEKNSLGFGFVNAIDQRKQRVPSSNSQRN